ncbi:SpaA isopeptide-forming pilin-related protein [Clostridium chromiireducens]|nr:SpaA isopeptide-forming pilin-related protein [Clostridium chromiireducens]
MSDILSNGDNKKTENINAIVSSENNYNEDCMIETAECKENDQEYILNANYKKMENKELCGGVIEVTSILECEEHEYLKGIKINLYKINGLSPILIRSMTTDDKGKAVFLGIEDGCYRIIEIVDKKYFEKPKYINWNEIIIDSINKNQKIVIVNRVKKIIP